MNSTIPHHSLVLLSYPRLRCWIVSAASLLCFAAQQPALAAADAFDEALDKLVAETVRAVEESGKTKVAVLDFPDITGAHSAFGKYLAEQISVGMVTAKKGFTVVDRANLRSILAEHQLTEEGLVKPENAKQLGEFSGVDALVLGTITSVNSGHIVTVKVLDTDKAELVGAAKSKLPLNPDFDAVINTDVAGADSKSLPAEGKKSPLEFKSEHFKATVRKIQILKSGEILVFFDFLKLKNESSVALYLHGYQIEQAYFPTREAADKAHVQALMSMPTTLRSSTGDDYKLVELQGISTLNSYERALHGRPLVGLSETQPTTTTFRFRLVEGGKANVPATTSFTLDSSVGIALREPRSDYDYRDSGVTNIHIEGVR
jgi:TolB-like protein